MADTKRKTPVAIPTLPSSTPPTPTVPLEVALAGCIGARVRVITTASPPNVMTGTIFTVSPLTSLLCLNTAAPPSTPSTTTPSTDQRGDYHILPLSSLTSFQILSLPSSPSSSPSPSPSPSPSDTPFTSALPSLKPLDIAALKRRERAAIEAELKHERSRGRGVGREAQDIYDALARTLPTRWENTSIVVLDSVTIRGPGYNVDDVHGQDKGIVQRVRKVYHPAKGHSQKLEMERKKLVDRSRATSRANTPTNAHPSRVSDRASTPSQQSQQQAQIQLQKQPQPQQQQTQQQQGQRKGG